MAFKNLEHDGGEDFLDQERTRRDEKLIKQKELEGRPSREEIEERLNARWLSPENPALWDGEI